MHSDCRAITATEVLASGASRAEAPRPGTLHVAVVHAGADICFVTAAQTPQTLARHLAEYVREHAPLQLWPEDARRVEELLALRRDEDAGAHYFRTVGGRWDRERLVVTTVQAE